jgi:hypothetical protein
LVGLLMWLSLLISQKLNQTSILSNALLAKAERKPASRAKHAETEGALYRVIVGTVSTRRASHDHPLLLIPSYLFLLYLFFLTVIPYFLSSSSNNCTARSPPYFSPASTTSRPTKGWNRPESPRCIPRRRTSPSHPVPQRDGRGPEPRRPPTQSLRVGGAGVHRRRRRTGHAGA